MGVVDISDVLGVEGNYCDVSTRSRVWWLGLVMLCVVSTTQSGGESLGHASLKKT